MVDFIADDAVRVLDVGSANGDFGRELARQRPHVRVWGIDPCPGESVTGYQSVFSGEYPRDMPTGMTFDCIVFNDVLEHMAEPWDALRATRDWLAAGGTVVASIPNVRHYRVIVPLVVRDQWTYADAGILDRTHLRFFTRRTVEELFDSTGYDVVRVEPLRLPTAGRRGTLRRITKRFDPFLTEQFGVVATDR